MKVELLSTINEIVKYGLLPNLSEIDKEKLLERNLVKIYTLYFDIEYDFDETDYLDYEDNVNFNIKQNVESNFNDFGLYKVLLDINDIYSENDNIAMSDAIDDLTDLITDLLEIKWRIEKNSLEDRLWCFKLIFISHTQQHILNLLNYLKNKNG